MYSESDDALSHWYSFFKSVLDSYAPLKKRHVKSEFIPEWFNTEIQAAIATRKHLHRKPILINNALNWREYCFAPNRVVHLVRYAERSFYHNLTIILEILKASGALFVLWRPLNAAIYLII